MGIAWLLPYIGRIWPTPWIGIPQLLPLIGTSRPMHWIGIPQLRLSFALNIHLLAHALNRLPWPLCFTHLISSAHTLLLSQCWLHIQEIPGNWLPWPYYCLSRLTLSIGPHRLFRKYCFCQPVPYFRAFWSSADAMMESIGRRPGTAF